MSETPCIRFPREPRDLPDGAQEAYDRDLNQYLDETFGDPDDNYPEDDDA